MEDLQVQELERLLAQVMDNIVLRPGPAAPRMIDLDSYRDLLLRCRRYHDPDSRLLIANLTPAIEGTAIRDRLLEIVRRELSGHIQDDRVHSGTCVIEGESADGTPIDEILQNLLVRSIADGPDVAARAFAECVSAPSFSYSRFVLLTSLTLDTPVDVFDGVRLIPLPAHSSGLPPFMPTVIRHGGDTEMVLSKVVLCVEKTVAPVFHRPTGEFPRSHFSTTLASEDAPNLDLGALYQALSLASEGSVRPTMKWNALLDYEIFDLRTDRVIGTTGWSSNSPHMGLLRSPSTPKATLTESGLRDLQELYRMIVGLDPKTREHLQIPIERWMRSMEQWETVDRMTDLSIALEALYLGDDRDRRQRGPRLALRAAWHLADDRSGHERLSDIFKTIYDLRSQAVHEGRLDGTVTAGGQTTSTYDFVKEVQQLCRGAICAVIRAGKLPDWDSLVLG